MNKNVATKNTVELLPFTDENRYALVDFLVSFPGETREAQFWFDRFCLWWDRNPAMSEEFIKGWILKENGKLVGFLGTFPSYFQLFGKKTVVHNATTWRVSPDYRNHSLRLLFKQIETSQGTLLFMTTPNETVTRVIKSQNYQLIERPDQRAAYWVTNFGRVFQSFAGRNLAVRTLGIGIAPFFHWIQNVRLKPSKSALRFEAKEIFHADSAFDELWTGTRDRYPNTYVRTAETINWYCFASPHFKKHLFGVYQGSQLKAYGIFIRRQSRKLNLWECIDFWGNTDEGVIKALLVCLKKCVRKCSIDLIKFPSFSRQIGELFRRAGLFRVGSREREEYFKISTELKEVFSENDTYFTYSVGDVGL